jgi:hypothetical protein
MPRIGVVAGGGLNFVYGMNQITISSNFKPSLASNWVHYSTREERKLQALSNNSFFEDDDWSISNLSFSIGYGILMGKNKNGGKK